MLQGPEHRSSRAYLPQPGGTIEAARDHGFSVRTEGRGPNLVAVAKRRANGAAVRRPPQLGGPIVAGRHEEPAVGAEGQRVDQLLMPERRADRLAGRDLPQAAVAPPPPVASNRPSGVKARERIWAR